MIRFSGLKNMKRTSKDENLKDKEMNQGVQDPVAVMTT